MAHRFIMDAGNAYYSVMFTSTPINHLYGPNGNDITNTYMNTDEAVNQLKDFQDISSEVGLEAKNIDFKHNDAQFSAGKLAMEVCGSWKIDDYEEDDNKGGQYDKLLEYMNGLEKQAKYAYPMPNMSQSSIFWTPFSTAYANIWNNPGIDVKKELDQANSAATK